MNKKINYWLASLVMATLLVMLPFCSEGAPKEDQKDANKKENSESNGTNPGDGQSVAGKVGKYPYVDLGLPSGLKWATYNVGATSPEEYGDYFAWGETKPQAASDSSYSWATYKWCNGDGDFLTKYCTQSRYGTVDSLTTLLPEDDAATANWGGAWRMPTRAEQKELIEGCDWEWTDDYNSTGVSGQIGTSKTNGNTIFLPAAGGRNNGSLSDVRGYGYYWSSSLRTGSSFSAYVLYFNSGYIDWDFDNRLYGLAVRAVSGK
ncbi:MAG: DUF1566 domain-containing protein [Paludibacteraceae bacterium]|nr:DUF1566 domain-containing protein [Paludibacteraceae bacterium]